METNPLVLINGRRDPCISPGDRGFQYGDGVFSTLRVVDGVPLFGAEHLSRLQRDAARIRLPSCDLEVLRSEMGDLAKRCPQGILKIQLTRGVAGRGYRPPKDPVPTRLLSVHPADSFPLEMPAPKRVRFSDQRLSINPSLAGVKHMNRLEQILARMEWEDPGIFESLMLDTEGFVVEGTMTNLFFFDGHKLLTPLLDRCGVQGVMRDLLMGMARRNGLQIEELRIEPHQIWKSHEMFLTNSVLGILPVDGVGDRRLKGGTLGEKIHRWYLLELERSLSAWG